MDHDEHTNRLFGDLPPGPPGYARLHLYAVISRMLSHLGVHAAPRLAGLELRLPGLGPARDADDVAREPDAPSIAARFPFLAGYRALFERYVPGGLDPVEEAAWWDAQFERWELDVGARPPLAALEAADFERGHTRLLVAAGLVEEDVRFGALFAALQEPLLARRPCLGLFGWLLAEPGDPPADLWPVAATLLDAGLLLAENRADPRSEWVLRVPPPIWDAALGRSPRRPAPGLELQPADEFPWLDELILPDTLQAQVGRLPELLASGQVAAVALRGMSGSGRRTTLGSVGRQLGRGLLLWTGSAPGDDAWKLLGPLATLLGALPAARLEPGPGEALELPPLSGYRGPLGIALGRAGGLRGALAEDCLTLTIPPADRAARLRSWEQAGQPLASGQREEIVDRFLFSPGHIRRVAALAAAYARLDGRAALAAADVQRASRALNRQALDTLTTLLEPAAGWSDLVVGEAVGRELRNLEQRCLERERLREQVGTGVGRTLTRGVRALLSGPSGTGKTLAARALAAELEKDLYRVDLAAVVNKYIGETERNLNLVLSRAEELDVVLLLDEGDALMTNRTEVRNSTDRYANLETNYLLQRLESYEGIILVTTNAGQRIDQAFLRRLDAVIDFSPPDAAERWLIWQAHLPGDNEVSPEVLADIATRCTLSGGQIRNAALQATLLALGDGTPVEDRHVEAALQREYRKAGAAYPLRPRERAEDQLGRLARLAAELA